MPDKVRIALDAMGGDHGPGVVVAGAGPGACSAIPRANFYSSATRRRWPRLSMRSRRSKRHPELVHTEVAVSMDDKPSQALRYGRWKSSMWLAIEAVKKGDADVAVSGGNTGALMAMAKFELKMLPGIERPAIAALWPTLAGRIRSCSISAPRSAPMPSTSSILR